MPTFVYFYFNFYPFFQKLKPLSKEAAYTKAIVTKFANRLQEKFKKIGDTFRFFDRNYDNSISFKEFRVVCEELDMRFTQNELSVVFNYLDGN